MVSFDAALDAHEVAVRARVDELQEEAVRVTVALGEAELALERVEITRATMAEVLAGQVAAQGKQEVDASVDSIAVAVVGALAPVLVPAHRADLSEDALPSEYRRMWRTLQDASGPVQVKVLAGLLGLEVSAAKVEGLRSKLKRLVKRGWIVEVYPGVFALAAGR
jgi:hypothetical protein